MKKMYRPPTLPSQFDNPSRARSNKGPSASVSALSCNFKKAILPRSVDLMITLKYRR